MPRPAAILLVLAAALGLAGCGFKQEPTGERAQSWPVTVADAVGDPVVLPAPPRRIVSLDRGATRTLALLGVDVPVDTAVEADPEATAGADLLIVPFGTSPDTVATLSGNGEVPVFHFGGVPYGDAPRAIARLGLAVGRGPEGAALARRTDAALRQVHARADGVEARAVIDAGSLRALGPETPLGRAVAFVGGRNVADRTRYVTVAELRRLDPTAWILAPGADTTIASLRRQPALRDVDAVRSGRVLEADGADYETSPDLPAALADLQEALEAPARPS